MNSLQIISLPGRFHQEPRGWTFTPFNESPLADGLPFDWASFHTVSMRAGLHSGKPRSSPGQRMAFVLRRPLPYRLAG